MKRLDHIVWAVPDLQEGINWIEVNLKTTVYPGGRHLKHGTHNAIVILDDHCYLEIIAKDPESDNPHPWMAVNDIDHPAITRLSIKSDKLDADAEDLGLIDSSLSEILVGERLLSDGSKLNWRMTRPSTRKGVDPIPFYLEWAGNIHPTSGRIPQAEIAEINIFTPEYETIAPLYNGSKVSIKEAGENKISLRLRTDSVEISI